MSEKRNPEGRTETDVAGRQDGGEGPEGTYILSDLEQVKVLADPLRIRLLESFAEERTTKQVAELLDEKPTRLYHHVDALERVGLIRLARTRPNRGTVEKYYIAVARTFQTDSALFSAHPGDEDLETLQGVVSTMLSSTANELRALIADRRGDCLEDEGLLSFVEIRAEGDDLTRLRERFMSVLEEMASESGEGSGPGTGEESGSNLRRFRLMLAFYPLDRDRRGGEPDD